MAPPGRPASGSAPSSCRRCRRALCSTCRHPARLSVERGGRAAAGAEPHDQDGARGRAVFGKAGRAATATDPAPLEMIETVVTLKPEDEWRAGHDHRKLIAELDRPLQLPGVTNAWTMPIKARIDMLSTGIRTPVGIKVFGTDLAVIERSASESSGAEAVPGTHRALPSASPAATTSTIERRPRALARYGVTVSEVREVIEHGTSAANVTTTVEGRERFGVNVRYPRELRSDPQAIATEVLVPRRTASMIPLGQLATIKTTRGAPAIRTENALAFRLRFRRHARPGHRRFRRGRAARGARGGQASSGLLPHLERPIRVHGARQGAPDDRRAAHAARDLRAALPELPPPRRDADRDAVGALLRSSAASGSCTCSTTT